MLSSMTLDQLSDPFRYFICIFNLNQSFSSWFCCSRLQLLAQFSEIFDLLISINTCIINTRVVCFLHLWLFNWFQQTFDSKKWRFFFLKPLQVITRCCRGARPWSGVSNNIGHTWMTNTFVVFSSTSWFLWCKIGNFIEIQVSSWHRCQGIIYWMLHYAKYRDSILW